MFKDKSILITGGTGSFGKAMIKYLLKLRQQPRRMIIFSRDELKQFELQKMFDQKKHENLRFFIGDVRDKERLNRAFEGVDILVHAAALKQVPTAEYNPIEYIKTNILGAQNIIDASLDSKINKVVALSTDKASSPINLYGATKLCSDKLFTSANNIKGNKDIKYSVVRYGNVFGSRGSIAPIFNKMTNNKFFPITDYNMTRFNITLKKSVEMVSWVIKNMEGGEIFVPKIPSFNVVDLAKAFDDRKKLKQIGIRPGEKIHEEMISLSDAINTIDLKDYYAILNDYSKTRKKYRNSKYVKKDFYYNSSNNSNFLNLHQLKKLIKTELTSL